MSSSPRAGRVIATLSLAMTPVLAAGAQSSVAVSPFVSYIPSAATNPLAGFALTFGGTTGLALRSSAEMSISTPRVDSAAATGGYRPWGADADAMLFLGGLGGGATVFSRALSPYVFAGIGLTGQDSSGKNVVRQGWSYGAGATIPLGFHAGIFAEARWRLSEYVLPTSKGAPDSKTSMRFGLSFNVGGGGSGVAPSPRPRHRVAEADDDVEYVVTQAPAPQVVVVEQQPAPEPVVIVQEQAARDPVVIVQQPPVQEPVIVTTDEQATTVVYPQRSRSRRSTVSSSSRQPRIIAPTRSRPPARVIRGSSRATAEQVQAQVQSQSQRNTRVRQGSSAGRTSTVRKSTTATTVRKTAPRAQVRTPVQAPAKTQARTETQSTTRQRGATSSRARNNP